ncbi:MAG: alpha/beta fold hydrolase [Thermoplasmata archaeon]|nr:MAG: alpha/beta fold hydrolase [Thermoplasmata archaeon]
MAETDEWIKCPECSKRVKLKNLGKHLQRVHDMSMSEARSKKEEMLKEKKKAREGAWGSASKNKKLGIGAVAVVIIVVIAALAGKYVFFGDEDENGSTGNGPPEPDPTRVEFVTEDGFKIVGNYYTAKAGVIDIGINDRPVLILAHGMNENREIWNNNYGFVDTALDWGFNVLIYDIRGHGESVYKNGEKIYYLGIEDTKNIDEDVHSAVEFVLANYASNGRMAVVGASISANAALIAAVFEENIRALALLSPSLNEEVLPTYQAMWDYGDRPVFIAVGEFEEGNLADDSKWLYDQAIKRNPNPEDVVLEIYDNATEHGSNLFKIDKFNTDLENYLKKYMIELPER